MTERSRPPLTRQTPNRSQEASGLADVDTPPWSLLTDVDIHLFNEGTHCRLYEKLGAHPHTADGATGTYFAVWAPNAAHVSLMGEFNGWDRERTPLVLRGSSGIWEGFVSEATVGQLYKYHIRSRYQGYEVDKADPFGFAQEIPPRSASAITDLSYRWRDEKWMSQRSQANKLGAPTSIYEVHLGSWMRVAEQGNRSLGYRELAPKLIEYVTKMGFTHVELLPVMEHPFFGSWGYQVTAYFAPSSRFGTPHELMFLLDALHQADIGVILDWVPAHFPKDEFGLGYFDGTHLYEHADPRQGTHPDWDSFIFNYSRNEVQSFLLSSAMFWLDRYHADGLRVDGVASMLYLDYSRKEGEWIPNEYGGRENLGAVRLLRRFNEIVYENHPDVQTIAEESTAWPMVSRPTYLGGLGFGLKWDMGWMHDTLRYMSKSPIHRKYHHQDLTFRSLYAFHENFVLPLSHDEVVHGKGSLLGKMPGDEWQKFANLRLLFAYMYGLPGKKLLFMGGEIAQWGEWQHDGSVEWHLLRNDRHRGIQDLVSQLNRLYRTEPALHELDCDSRGFQWIDANDAEQSVLAFSRHSGDHRDAVAVVCNFTPVPRQNFRVGVDHLGGWKELVNTDAKEYGGSGHGNFGRVEASPVPWHGRRFSLNLVLPPLGAIYLKADEPG
ncbi:MAG TPA: 1,4-alpha-glucan branching protein GlgB [Vicinamibacteria bacterium]|nr:1,4-alpha-glucan branching protein GlgB [Vicinamibacteria bacterium]